MDNDEVIVQGLGAGGDGRVHQARLRLKTLDSGNIAQPLSPGESSPDLGIVIRPTSFAGVDIATTLPFSSNPQLGGRATSAIAAGQRGDFGVVGGQLVEQAEGVTLLNVISGEVGFLGSLSHNGAKNEGEGPEEPGTLLETRHRGRYRG